MKGRGGDGWGCTRSLAVRYLEGETPRMTQHYSAPSYWSPLQDKSELHTWGSIMWIILITGRPITCRTHATLDKSSASVHLRVIRTLFLIESDNLTHKQDFSQDYSSENLFKYPLREKLAPVKWLAGRKKRRQVSRNKNRILGKNQQQRKIKRGIKDNKYETSHLQ